MSYNISYQPLDYLPVWAFFLLACVLIYLPLELGFRYGRHRFNRAPGESDSSAGVYVGAMLALLAFILAFTFGMAGARFENRRQAVLEEANAIGTAYLRSDFLPAPQSSEIAQLLRDYLDIRLSAQLQDLKGEELRPAIEQSQVIATKIWSSTVSIPESDSVMTALFITALNNVIDVNSKRIAYGTQSWLPPTLWIGLLIISTFALASAGYLSGHDSNRRSPIMFGLLPAFAVVITLIVDLDNPLEGYLRPSLAPLIDLQQNLATR